MKSYFYKALLLTGVCAVNASAISLYDTAPSVGLPLSHAATYNAYASVGYDTNINSSSVNQKSSVYLNAGVGASFADFESVDKITYRFNVGATKYLSESDTSGREWNADCGLTASLVHAFSARSTYSGSVNLSYSPEPDYASGISASHRQGDCLNWIMNHGYNQSLDARWSWNTSVGYSGVLYQERDYQNDNRQYVNLTGGMSYRESELMSYNVSFSYRHDIRKEGYNSDNYTVNVGFSRSLDPVSSCSGSIGLQTKCVHNETILSPNLQLGYNRKVAEGLSANLYVNLSNENVDTYRGVNANYLSDLTWRAGANCSYTLSPDVTFTFGLSFMNSNYSKGTGRLSDESTVTVNPTVGMSYRFSEDLTGNINYQYTWYDTDRAGVEGYTRHNISTGLNYAF